jgi:hypothetical protein
MAEAISLAEVLNVTLGLARALYFAAGLAHFERNPAKVEPLASDLIALSTRHNFASYALAGAAILRGWARSASGQTVEGISGIESGIENYQAHGSAIVTVPFWLALAPRAAALPTQTLEKP